MKNLSPIVDSLDVVNKQYVDNAAEAKVDKVEGKHLSTNDFTDEYKNKLEQLNVVQVSEMPTASAANVGNIVQYIGVTDSSYTNGFFYKNGEITQENGTKIFSWMNIKVQEDSKGVTDYNELENIPSLNGVELKGDITAADLGINDTNMYYGSEAPTDENVVMWIDPNGAPTDVLTMDNTVAYVPTGDYNPATKKYVDESIANIDIPDPDLSGLAKKDELPTKVSDLTNDAGFIVSTVDNLTNYYKKSETYTQAEVNNLINAITTLNIEVVASLPTSNISTTTIYLKGSKKDGNNSYEEYIYVNGTWELIGTTAIDLTPYATKTYVDTEIDNVAKSALGLGETSTTAYRGDYGKTAYTHAQVKDGSNPHATTFANIASKPTTIAGYGITDAKIANGTITLGANTITPLTSGSSLDATKLSGTASISTTGNAKTATTADSLKNVTATAAELNVLDGITATTAELNYVDGVTSNIQTQLNNKANKSEILTKTNTTAFTPSGDYQPATKKYVDDKISSGSSSLSQYYDVPVQTITCTAQATAGSSYYYAFNTNSSGYHSGNPMTLPTRLSIDLGYSVVAKKIMIKTQTSVTAFSIEGSHNGEDWVSLADITNSSANEETYTLNNTEAYRYYAMNVTTATGNYFYVYRFQIVEALFYGSLKTNVIPNMTSNLYTMINPVLNVDLPLASYQKGQILPISLASNAGEVNYQEETFTSNIIPTFSSAANVTNKYGIWTYGGATDQYYMYDGDSSTYARGSSKDSSYNAWIGSATAADGTLFAIKPTKVTVVNASGLNNSGSVYQVRGYDYQTGVWDTIATNIAKTGTVSVDITTDKYYSKIGLYWTTGSTLAYLNYISEFQINAGSIRYGTLIAQPLSKAYQPVLQINGLEPKLIDAVLTAGSSYDLVYNGNNWDVAHPYKVLQGTYSSSVSTVIDLGGRPKFVIAFNTGSSPVFTMVSDSLTSRYLLDYIDNTGTSSTPCYVPGYNGGKGSITITDNGFSTSGTFNSGNYIAIL